MSQTRSDICIILPLKENKPPYEKQISDLRNYISQDELVIPISILSSFDKNQKLYMTFEEFRIEHQRTAAVIVVTQMDDPFGKGAFAGEKGLPKGSMLAYSGVYSSVKSYVGSPEKDQVYLTGISDDLVVDSRNMVNKARYFQHLPDEIDSTLTKYLGDNIATENICHSKIHFSIKLNNKVYVVPVAVLITNRDINPNEILGYSYGNNSYWHTFQMTPSFFHKDGKPFEGACIEVYEAEDKNIKFILDKKSLQNFLETRIAFYQSNKLLILPEFIKELCVGKSNGAFLPCLYYVQCESGKPFIGTVHNESVIHFPLKNPFTIDLALTLDSFNCRINFIEGNNDAAKLVVNLSDLSKLDFEQTKKLFKLFNEIAASKSDCFFTIISNSKLIAKITSQGKPTTPSTNNGFFSPANTARAPVADDKTSVRKTTSIDLGTH